LLPRGPRNPPSVIHASRQPSFALDARPSPSSAVSHSTSSHSPRLSGLALALNRSPLCLLGSPLAPALAPQNPRCSACARPAYLLPSIRSWPGQNRGLIVSRSGGQLGSAS
jgi:hypothetical protein